MEIKKYKPKFSDTSPSYNDYTHKPPPFYKTKVSEIDLINVKPQRAGIILYTKINNIIYFGVGVDNNTKEYTDFGGGIQYQKDGNVIAGAIREFTEETLQIFGQLEYHDVKDCLALYNLNNLVIFKYVTQNINLIRENFLHEYRYYVDKGIKPEVCDIAWLTQNEFKHEVMVRGNMFHRLQCFLQKAGEFYWLL